MSKRRGKVVALMVVIALFGGIGAGVASNLIFGEPSKEVSKRPEKKTEPVEKAQKEESNGKLDFRMIQAMSHAYVLSEEIGSRPAGSVREEKAAEYIAGKLSEYGYKIGEQSFSFGHDFESRNIVATCRGRKEDYTLVIGSHYDTAGESVGADNNASGVGVLLELSRVFSRSPALFNLEFVFFGANVPRPALDGSKRFFGSREFVRTLSQSNKIVGMICLDGVGVGSILALGDAGKGPGRLEAKVDTYTREKNILAERVDSTTDSDNIPFEEEGIPSVWIRWCEAGGGYPNDVGYQNLVPQKIDASGKLLEGFIRSLSLEDLEELR
ncbi:MAG: M28 family peptidase [Actinomycetota bacterium]|nr:M28 family peptidase [Actinomycetota bacterium]